MTTSLQHDEGRNFQLPFLRPRIPRRDFATRLCIRETCASAVIVVLLYGVRMPPGSHPISTSSNDLHAERDLCNTTSCRDQQII